MQWPCSQTLKSGMWIGEATNVGLVKEVEPDTLDIAGEQNL